MAEVQKLTVVTLSNKELCEAICEYVERMYAGDMPQMEPATIQMTIPHHGRVFVGMSDGVSVTVSNHRTEGGDA